MWAEADPTGQAVPADHSIPLQLLRGVLSAFWHAFPPGLSSVLKGVTVTLSCLLSLQRMESSLNGI